MEVEIWTRALCQLYFGNNVRDAKFSSVRFITFLEASILFGVQNNPTILAFVCIDVIFIPYTYPKYISLYKSLP